MIRVLCPNCGGPKKEHARQCRQCFLQDTLSPAERLRRKKAGQKRYRESPRGKEIVRQLARAYYKTARGRALKTANWRKYSYTEKGRIATRRSRIKFFHTPQGKEFHAWRVKRYTLRDRLMARWPILSKT